MEQPKSKNSLGQMMELLRDLDDDMLPEEFDPETLIGDIRDKVDAISWKINDWKHKALMIDEEYIQPLTRKAATLRGKAERLKEYVRIEMQRLEVERIPGNLCRVQLQNSQKSVELTEAATPSLYLNYPELIRQKTEYLWDREAIRAHIEAGESFTFANLVQKKHIRFYALGESK